MIYEIRNEKLTVKINSLGAELISVIDNKTKTEFVWQGDEKYWKGHSPVLFPQCGRIFNQKYLYNGEEFEMGLHGFARHTEFKIENKTNSSIELFIEDNEETRKIYPFKFRFVVGYKLNNETLEFTFRVINEDNKEIYFSYGGHPGFNCPIGGVGNFDDYYLEFTKSSYKQRKFTENFLYNFENKVWELKDKQLPLVHSLFDNDAIFFETTNDVVCLKNKINKNYIKVSFNNMKAFGFWHQNKTDAPFICFEPQYGFPGLEGAVGEIKDKFEESKLSVGEEHFNSYNVEFHIE